MKAIRAIVPAAGKGKRLQPISGDTAKAMFRVCGKPMLQVSLDNIGFIDASNIFIVVGRYLNTLATATIMWSKLSSWAQVMP